VNPGSFCFFSLIFKQSTAVLQWLPSVHILLCHSAEFLSVECQVALCMSKSCFLPVAVCKIKKL
jgi:hypothetical protein